MKMYSSPLYGKFRKMILCGKGNSQFKKAFNSQVVKGFNSWCSKYANKPLKATLKTGGRIRICGLYWMPLAWLQA